MSCLCYNNFLKVIKPRGLLPLLIGLEGILGSIQPTVGVLERLKKILVNRMMLFHCVLSSVAYLCVMIMECRFIEDTIVVLHGRPQCNRPTTPWLQEISLAPEIASCVSPSSSSKVTNR